MELLAEAFGSSLEEMQQHSSFIINAFDHQHTILFWNDKCAAHFRIRPEEAIGRKLEEVLPWVKTDEKLVYIDRALSGKNMQVIKVPYRMKSGYYEQYILPVKDNQGKVIAALNIVVEMQEAANIPAFKFLTT